MQEQDIQKLAHGTSITFLGGIVGAALTYLTGILISRLVETELVGVYYLSLIWQQLLSAATRFGFSDALLRFIPPELLSNKQEHCTRIAKTVCLLGILFSIVLASALFFLLPVVGRWAGWEPGVTSYVRWFLLFTPLHVAFVLLLMVTQAYQRMMQVVIARDFVQPTVLCLATVLLLAAGADEQFGLVGGFVASLIIGVMAIWRSARKLVPDIAVVPGWMALGPLFVFAVPNAASDVTYFLYRWVDTLMVSRFLELRDVGIYSAAVRTSLLLSLIPMAVNAIYATMASGYYHTDRHDSLNKLLQVSLRWSLIVAIPVSMLFVLAGREILLLWGSEFVEGDTALSVLALAQLFGVPAAVLGYTLVMCNRQLLEFFNTAALLALIVGVNAVLIPILGLLGAAASLLIVNVAALSIRWVQIGRLLRLKPFKLTVVKPLANALVTGLIGFAAVIWLRRAFGGVNMTIPEALMFLSATLIVLSTFYIVGTLIMGLEEEDRAFVNMIRKRLAGAGGRG